MASNQSRGSCDRICIQNKNPLHISSQTSTITAEYDNYELACVLENHGAIYSTGNLFTVEIRVYLAIHFSKSSSQSGITLKNSIS